MKKITSLFLMLTLMLAFVTVYAEPDITSTKEDETEVIELVNKYNLSRTKEIPIGITPLRIDSIEEAESILKELNIVSKTSSMEIIQPNNIMSKSSQTYDTNLYSSQSVGPCKVNLRSKLTVQNWGSFREIIGNAEYTYLSGNTLGTYWYPEETSGSSDGKSYFGYTKGYTKTYLVIMGVHLFDTENDIYITNSYSVY